MTPDAKAAEITRLNEEDDRLVRHYENVYDELRSCEEEGVTGDQYEMLEDIIEDIEAQRFLINDKLEELGVL